MLNVSGNPVAVTSHTFQLDLPCEAAADLGVIDWFSIIPVVLQLIAAVATGNPAAIIAAIQALLKVVMGS